MKQTQLSIPEKFWRGSNRRRELGATDAKSGADLMELMWRRTGLKATSEIDLLDIGCGTRLAEAIVAYDIPLRRYVGLDVFRELIEYMREHAVDDRLELQHVNLHNEMYNPTGELLSLDYDLPVGDRRFDVISLFSVFTHLDPRDADCMLAVLRRYLKPDGRLIFSCFLDDGVTGFKDAVPEKPLLQAVYSTALMEHLITRNGWSILQAYPPERAPEGYWLIQHHFVCGAQELAG